MVILTPEEVETLTGYKRRAEQKNELEHLRIPYKVRRDGSTVVAWNDVRSTIDPPEPEPKMWT